jgi:hypothetical protein
MHATMWNTTTDPRYVALSGAKDWKRAAARTISVSDDKLWPKVAENLAENTHCFGIYKWDCRILCTAELIELLCLSACPLCVHDCLQQRRPCDLKGLCPNHLATSSSLENTDS